MAANMPKLLVSNTIPVFKAHSLRQLSTIARSFPAARKRVTADLATRRNALAKAKAPKAYTTKDRAALITKAGLAFNPPTDDLTLSVRKPYVEGAGHLYFFNVSDYMTDQDRAVLFMTKLGGEASSPYRCARARRAPAICSTYRCPELPASSSPALPVALRPPPTSKVMC